MSNLEELVTRYGNLKAEADSYKKQIDADNAEIKSLMSASGLSEFRAGGFIAKFSTIVSEDFDPDMLLAKIKELGLTDLIATREYVDIQLLENAIYTGKINASELAHCKTRKETSRLTIKRDK